MKSCSAEGEVIARGTLEALHKLLIYQWSVVSRCGGDGGVKGSAMVIEGG